MLIKAIKAKKRPATAGEDACPTWVEQTPH